MTAPTPRCAPDAGTAHGSTTGRCAIAIMAKTPRPGRSKTRLCPPLTPEQAAALSAAFVADMTATVRRAGSRAPIDGYVAYAPAGGEEALHALAAPGTRLLLADGDGVEDPGVVGFGRALLQTLRVLLARGYGSVCVLNSDSPDLPEAVLAAAAAALGERSDRVVLGPASDGGYYLLGACAAHPALFADIAWSTGQVADQTRRQARRAGLNMVELECWYDVDDAAGLNRLIRALDQPNAAAGSPATAATLAGLRLDERLNSLA